MNRAYCERISKQLEKDCGRLLSERDCMDLAEDVCLVMELDKFRRPVVEWLNGKMQFTDVIVNGFSLVQVASALNQRRPNIPVVASCFTWRRQSPTHSGRFPQWRTSPAPQTKGCLKASPARLRCGQMRSGFSFQTASARTVCGSVKCGRFSCSIPDSPCRSAMSTQTAQR